MTHPRPVARFLALLAVAAGISMVGCAEPESREAGGSGEALALTLENIHRTASGVSEGVPSPDGSWIAASAEGPEGRGIYLLPADAAASPDAATFRVEGSQPAWTPDGTELVFVRDGEIRIARAQDGEARTLTALAESGAGSPRDPEVSPDGGSVAFWVAGEEAQDLWVVPLEGGEARKVTEGAMVADDSRFRPSWSPDASRLAYVSNEADWWHDDIWVVEVETGERRQLSTELMASSTPVWSPSGDRLAVLATRKDEYWYQDLSYLVLVDPEGGGEEIVEMEVFATDFIMRHEPVWSADGEILYFPYQERGITNLWAVPAGGGVATRVTNLDGSVRSISASADASLFTFIHASPTSGSEILALPAVGGAPRQVGDFSPEWEGVRAPREISFESFDGLHIQGFLYTPREVEAGAVCPALVQVHGGGTNSYLQGLNLTEQYLASQGFVVLAINYRGGSGFGRAFQDLAIEDWLNEQALDAGAAADHLRTLDGVNDRVGIYGGSYGGSMSLAAATRTPGKFDAAVPMRGAYSKTETLEYTDRLGQIFTITGHGGTPEERPDSYAKSNTVDRLDRLEAPVLLMHGEQDRRVPIQHFEIAVAELERLGKEYETHTYPEEGHGFRDPANRIDMYQRLEAFFREHLGTCQGGEG